MTGEQRSLYLAALRIGRAFGTGGSSWTPIAMSGATPSADVTMTVGALVTMYVIENNLVARAPSLPQTPIYTAPWWGVRSVAIDPNTVIVSASTGVAYLVTGVADTSQGFALIPLALTQAPDLASVGALSGFQAGLRIGAW